MERRGQQDIALKEAALPGLRAGQGGLAFARLKVAAERGAVTAFSNLLSQIDLPLLRCAFHSIKANAASGTDGITKKRYGEDLEANLCGLLTKLHTGSYKPSPSRQVNIPKGDGRLRPIAISNVEDKTVQRAVAFILEAIYEPIFTESSLGFRPRRGCHTAIQKAYRLLKEGRRPAVIDVDIEKFFNSMNHDRMMELLRRRIADRRFLTLVGILLKSSTMANDDVEVVNEIGSPQGSVVSPILANIFLHYVLDEWFQENEEGHYKRMVRYADDVLFCFRDHAEAGSFVTRLKERLHEYQLRMNESKTKVVDFKAGRHTVVNFLGFTFYWGRDRKGNYLLKLKTEAEKLRKKLLEFKLWIQRDRNRYKLGILWREAVRKLQGHYAYYAITFNNKVWLYYRICLKLLFKWLNRRSQKRSFTWEEFFDRLKRNPLPRPYLGDRLMLRQDVFEFAV